MSLERPTLPFLPLLLLLSAALSACGGDASSPAVCTESCEAPPEPHCADARTLRAYQPEGRCTAEGCVYAPNDTDCPHGCVEGACRTGPVGGSCDGVVCDSPPAPACEANGTLRSFQTPGRCVEGLCEYEPWTVACAGGCADGACVGEPCAGKSCQKPPASTCVDAQTLRSYQTPGTCSEGECDYAATDTACAHGCESGACRGDPCAGKSCNTPPAAHCADPGTLRSFAPSGTCAGGTCSYTASLTTCAFGCAAGACQGDPCAGVSCSTPPAAYCADATTLRTFASGGTCAGGGCTYGSSDVTCAFGCAAGACKNDPCAGKSCTTPPATYCLDTTTLRSFVSPGSCGGGSCAYAPVDATCAFGCAAGACKADPCNGKSCTTPPVDTCVDASTARHYAGTGSCQQGTCGYAWVDEPCANGCQGGTCNPLSCGGTVCNTPPASTCLNARSLKHVFPGGQCVSHACSYASVTVDCSLGCFEGACIAGSGTVSQYPAFTGNTSLLSGSQLEVDASGALHMAVCSNAGNLLYRRIDAGGWRDEMVDPGLGSTCQVSLALLPNGQPAFAYYDSVNQDLRYAERTAAGGYARQLVSTTGSTGLGPSLVIGRDGAPWVSYLHVEGTAQALRVSTRGSGGLWTAETVLPTGASYRNGLTVLRLDAAGTLHVVAGSTRSVAVSTGGYNQPPVHHARRGASGWQVETVSEDGLIGTRPLAFDAQGTPLVVYGKVTQVGAGDEVRLLRLASTGRQDELLFGVGNLLDYYGENPRFFEDGRGKLTVYRRGSPLLRQEPDGVWLEDALLQTAFGPTATNPRPEDEALAPDGRLHLLSSPWVLALPRCTPSCSGRSCGNDGCGGSCGVCSVGGESCGPGGQCTAWQLETLSPKGTSPLGLAVGGGQTHVLTEGSTWNTLRLYSRVGGAFAASLDLLDVQRVHSRQALAVDPTGLAHVALSRSTTGTWGVFVYARTSAGWTENKLQPLSHVPSDAPAFVIDAAGVWHLVFPAGSSGSERLLYARRQGGTWQVETVAAIGLPTVTVQAERPALALDDAGKVHVAWVRLQNGKRTLQHSTNLSGSWVTTVIADPVQDGFTRTSVQLAWAAGELFVGYYGLSSPSRPVLARRTATGWEEVSLPTALSQWQGMRVTADGSLLVFGPTQSPSGAPGALGLFTRGVTGWSARPTLPLHGDARYSEAWVDVTGAMHAAFTEDVAGANSYLRAGRRP